MANVNPTQDALREAIREIVRDELRVALADLRPTDASHVVSVLSA